MKVLLIAPAWIGDAVIASALMHDVSLRVPAPRSLHVIAPRSTAPLFEFVASVERVIELPLGHGDFDLRLRRSLGECLARESYDQCIVLPNSWKSALIPYFAKIERRTGYVGEWRYGVLNDVRHVAQSHTTLMQRYVALGRERRESTGPVLSLPPPRLCVNETRWAAVQEKFDLPSGEAAKAIALCPGADYGPAKRWPPRHFARLADHFTAEGKRIWLLGSASDREAARIILGQVRTPHLVRDFTGETTLAEAVCLLSRCEMAICNDSGLMHVAAAVGARTLGIYGSSTDEYTPPIGGDGDDAPRVSGRKHPTASLRLPCSPCFQRQCPYGRTMCLTHLTPDFVIERLTERESSDSKRGECE